jgi:hypothetical protein
MHISVLTVFLLQQVDFESLILLLFHCRYYSTLDIGVSWYVHWQLFLHIYVYMFNLARHCTFISVFVCTYGMTVTDISHGCLSVDVVKGPAENALCTSQPYRLVL